MSKKLVVRIGDDQRRALRDRAEQLELSSSDLIRLAIRQLLANPAVTLPRVERDQSQAA
jgi:hypothetical protein